MSKAAMKLLLEGAANYIDVLGGDSRKYRQALAAQPAPVQEPVGYLEIDDIESQREYPHNCRNVNLWHEGGQGMAAIYTTPPAHRQWVGLTDEEVQLTVNQAVSAETLSWLGYKKDDDGKYTVPVLSPSNYQFARAIEAKLKEKNNG